MDDVPDHDSAKIQEKKFKFYFAYPSNPGSTNKGKQLRNSWSDFRVGALFESMFSPKGWKKTPPNCKKNKNASYRLYNGLTHFPRLVLQGPGPENEVQAPGPGEWGLGVA